MWWTGQDQPIQGLTQFNNHIHMLEHITKWQREYSYCFWIHHRLSKRTIFHMIPYQELHAMIPNEIQPIPNPIEDDLLSQLALVESQLLTLQNITINTSRLSRSGWNCGVETTSLELLLQSSINLSLSSESLVVLLLNGLALLGVWLLNGLTSLLLTSSAQVLTVVCLVPLSEWSSIDLNNGGFGEGVGSDQLVVGRMESDNDHTDLAGDSLRGPWEVTGFETEGTELAVTTTGTDEMDSLGSDTGTCFLSSGFESALLPCKSLSFQVGTYIIKIYGLSTTHGNGIAWRQRRSVYVCCHGWYPWLLILWYENN